MAQAISNPRRSILLVTSCSSNGHYYAWHIWGQVLFLVSLDADVYLLAACGSPLDVPRPARKAISCPSSSAFTWKSRSINLPGGHRSPWHRKFWVAGGRGNQLTLICSLGIGSWSRVRSGLLYHAWFVSNLIKRVSSDSKR